MARRRYVSTSISLDKDVNALAEECGDFAALLYTWMIVHAEDDTTITADPEDIYYAVCPRRKDKTPDDVRKAIAAMAAKDLVWPYTTPDGKPRLQFPPESFYRYQTYIPMPKRVYQDLRRSSLISPQNAEEHRSTPTNAEDRNSSAKTPQNTASPSPSLSPSPMPISKEGGDPPTPHDTFNRESTKPEKPSAEELADWAIVVEFARKNFPAYIGGLPPVVLDELREWHKQLSGACLIRAMQEALEHSAVKNGAPSWAYIRAICKKWIAVGVRQVEDIEPLERDREYRKARDKQAQQRDSCAPLSEEGKRKVDELTRQMVARCDINKAVKPNGSGR